MLVSLGAVPTPFRSPCAIDASNRRFRFYSIVHRHHGMPLDNRLRKRLRNQM
jgi:hypothetical protein